MTKLKNPVLLAIVGAPHGIRGEVRVKSFTGDPLAVGDYGALSTNDGQKLVVSSLRPSKNVVIVRFKGVTTREAAEALRNVELFVDRSALPPEEDEDDFYVADLPCLKYAFYQTVFLKSHQWARSKMLLTTSSQKQPSR